jgi:hypothetical protein
MAIAEMTPKVPKGAVQSFENRGERRATKRRAQRLTDAEVAELQDLWSGFAADIGFGSSHRNMEAHLLRSEPRPTARRHVLTELRKRGGRCPEVKLIAALVEDLDMRLTEGLTRYEVRGAIYGLLVCGKVERVNVPCPDGGPPLKDLRIVARPRGELRMLRALDSVPKERPSTKQRKEDALRAELAELHVDESGGGKAQYEHFVSRSRSREGRDIASALEAMTEQGAAVLKAAYGMPPALDAYGAGMWHVAALTSAVREERWRRAREAAAGRSLETGPAPVEIVVREGRAVRRVQSVLLGDATALVRTAAQVTEWELRRVTPEDVLRGGMGDAAFVAVVAEEAHAMLVRACSEYRKARGRG